MQPDVQQNLPFNMVARFPPALQSWEAFSQVLFSIQPTLPEYTGLDYEDPEKGLKGAAEKWWLCYKPMNLSFERFSELLRAQFDSQSIKSALVSKLYGTSQTEKESVGTFLQQKYMLYQRLISNEDEAAKIATMIEHLRPSVRKSLRSRTQ
ncbi:hypothetical protein TKK_0010829 [Trichogramma kaykai]